MWSCEPRALPPVRTSTPDQVVTLEEAKLYARIDWTDENALIESLIAAAEQRLDAYDGIIGQALLTQTWRQSFDRFGGSMIRLKVEPVQSVTSIKYFDADNVEQTVASLAYGLYADDLGPFVEPLTGQAWPSSVYTRRDAVTVTYVAGFGAVDAVPEPIKQAIKELVAYWFNNREAMGTIPESVTELIFPYKRFFV